MKDSDARRFAPYPRFARSRRRRAQRGATIFMVVVMTTALLGIGIFAARSAALATSASGFQRQIAQTHYLTEYALMLATSEVTGATAQIYRDLALNPLISAALKCDSTGPSVPCSKICSANIQSKLGALSQNVLETWSLGSASFEGDFCVELGGWYPSMQPLAGMSQAFRFYQVTATATAQVRYLNQGTSSLTNAAAVTASTESLRAYLIVGPMPGN